MTNKIYNTYETTIYPLGEGSRHAVGDNWDVIGKLQYDWMVSKGLRKGNRMLDIGCGCMRGGVNYAKLLGDGYYGIDVNASLIASGVRELSGVGVELPVGNLVVGDMYNIRAMDSEFDYAIAMSVFTHLPIEQLVVCLDELWYCMNSGGLFYFTIFTGDTDECVASHVDRDPYRYDVDNIRHWGWEIEYLGGWGHPVGQKMVKCKRLSKKESNVSIENNGSKAGKSVKEEGIEPFANRMDNSMEPRPASKPTAGKNMGSPKRGKRGRKR